MNWKNILKSFKNRDMQKRLAIVIGILITYRFLAHVPIPLAEPTTLKEVIKQIVTANTTTFGGFIDLLSGGAITSFSIIMAGLGPFITASIAAQLLTKAIPKLEEMHKDGESGRKKINQWTRIAAVPLAVAQSVAFIYILRNSVLAGTQVVETINSATIFQWVIAITAMSAASIMLMWLGELITEQGIGNGISLLVFAGILSQLPSNLGYIWNLITDTSMGKLNVFGWFELPISAIGTFSVIGLLIIGIITLYYLVKINEAQRIIVINYAKRVRGNTEYDGIKSILPIKLIAAGVIPIIFAVAFLSLPAFIGQILVASGNESWTGIGRVLIDFFQQHRLDPSSNLDITWKMFVYPSVYFLLVVMFTYFYTGIVINSNEIAENLQKSGAFISGVRPGLQTEKYLAAVVNRLTLFGSIVLGFISIMPFILELVFTGMLGIKSEVSMAIGGTGLLIVVSVGLETLRQINSRALMITYDDYKD